MFNVTSWNNVANMHELLGGLSKVLVEKLMCQGGGDLGP